MRIIRNKRKININVSPQVQKRLRSVLLLTTCENHVSALLCNVQSRSLTPTVLEALGLRGWWPTSKPYHLIKGMWFPSADSTASCPSWPFRMPPILCSLRKQLFFSPGLLFLFCFSRCAAHGSPLFPPHGSIFGTILQFQALVAFLELSFLPRSGIMFQASELFGRRYVKGIVWRYNGGKGYKILWFVLKD